MLTLVSILVWEIWKSKCKAVIEGRKLEPAMVLEKELCAKREFIDVWPKTDINDITELT
ncbi:hypothetical protein Pyn_10440 [Prunus yedoensis var. nudiflora]|uniref:Uncharacterized protein n=1 Tax=Prunus yedoensis var. nudiflora TaxID=2094558 RepID=A0A314XMT0_PRUYE|nr:hypothetical protein Pyn_10440 [Prunus yedoensis var. nudiflora]